MGLFNKSAAKAKGADNTTPVSTLVQEGKYPEFMEWVKKSGTDFESDPGPQGQTLLMYAAEKGHENILMVLLNLSANVYARDKDGLTAIDYARRNNHARCADLLLKHTRFLQEGFFKAVCANNIEKVREMLRDGFWENRPILVEWRHLQAALLSKDKPMIKLLAAQGVEVTTKDIENLSEDKVRLLLASGVKVQPYRQEATPPLVKEKTRRNGENFSTSEFGCALKGDRDFEGWIDGRITQLSREWRLVLQAFQNNGAEEAIIMGGALRDFYAKKDVTDVDIFIKSRGNYHENNTFLEKCFKAVKDLKVHRQWPNGAYSGCDFDGPNTKPRDEKMTSVSLESWKVIVGPDNTVYNIIFVAGGDTHQLVSGLFLERMLSLADFGLCQIATNGVDLFTTEQYKTDVREKRLTLIDGNPVSLYHLQRLRKKYPDHVPCDQTKRMLNAPGKRVRPLLFRP